MERYLKFREEYSRFFYRGYDVEETLNELKITYTFEIEGLSAFTPTWTFPKNGNPNYFLITGEYYIGKSSFLKYLYLIKGSGGKLY